MDREELIRAMSDAESTDLAVLKQAAQNAKQAYLKNSTKANLESWKAAERAAEDYMAGKAEEKAGQDEAAADERKVLENLNQAVKYLQGLGFRVSYNSLKKYLVTEERVPKRKGGGWTAAALKTLATKYLHRKVNESPDADKPVAPKENPQPVAADLRAKEHAARLAVQRQLDEVKLKEALGLLVETATMERELALRCKAFRLALEKWGLDMAEPLAGIFGGEAEAARELLNVLGLGEDQAPVVVEFAQARAERFRTLWRESLESFLDAFATGHWWTEEMRAAWEKMQAAEAAQDPGEADAS